MENKFNKSNFKYARAKNTDFNISEKTKDDTELLRFIGIDNPDTKLVYYDNTPVGFVCESSYMGLPEFQYAIFKEFRGLGIASYLLEDFRQRKFADNHKAIVLLIDKDNERSIKTAKKNGFRLDDTYEEFNSDNKETPYYVFYQNNPNYISKRGR